MLDLRDRSSYAEILVIASGTSDRHVQAISENVCRSLKKASSVKPLSSEGVREGQWALIDFGQVILHVFHPFTRDLYALEELWNDAPKIAFVESPAAKVGP